MIHPALRTTFLLQEFLQQKGKAVEVRIGSSVSVKIIAGIDNDQEATDYLRWRTYLLGRRANSNASRPVTLHQRLVHATEKVVATAVDTDSLVKELAALPPGCCLIENGELAVYAITATEGPHLIEELGRLREVTFRDVGEGTGKCRDLDRFDDYYWHLLLWNKTKREVVGAYRIGKTSEIIPQRGVEGLYTSTLFRYDLRLFEKLGPAPELGRSFVRPEYQRQYAPLLLLWKGIARMVGAAPETPVLFGAVSISNEYSRSSREMIYRFFEPRIANDKLAGMVAPRSPFRPERLRPWDCRAMGHALRDIDDLGSPISDLEHDGKGIPILLRQYAKVGGKMLGFNVDRKFSNVLDGLVLVDLRQTEPAVLERYMGSEGMARFRKHHGL